MTIDDFIKVPWSWRWKCHPPLKKYATVQVVFSYKIRPPYRVLDETEFDIEIPAEKAEKITTVEEAVEMIKGALN